MIKFISSAFAVLQPLATRTLQIHVGLLMLCMLAPALAMWSVASNSVLLISTIGNLIWIAGMCGVGLGMAFGIDYLIRHQVRRSRSLPSRMRPEDLRSEVEAVLQDIIQDDPAPANYLASVQWRLEALLTELGSVAATRARDDYEAEAAEQRRKENLQLAS